MILTLACTIDLPAIDKWALEELRKDGKLFLENWLAGAATNITAKRPDSPPPKVTVKFYQW